VRTHDAPGIPAARTMRRIEFPIALPGLEKTNAKVSKRSPIDVAKASA
jgi:hypothetical protein